MGIFGFGKASKQNQDYTNSNNEAKKKKMIYLKKKN